MYIKDNRLYAHEISFELPRDIQVTIGASGNLTFFRDNEAWVCGVIELPGFFGQKELEEHISECYAENAINSMRTYKNTTSGITYFQVCYTQDSTDQACSYFFNVRFEEDVWMYCQVDFCFYDFDSSINIQIENHPVICAFINSIRKEPMAYDKELPDCVINELKRKNGSS